MTVDEETEQMVWQALESICDSRSRGQITYGYRFADIVRKVADRIDDITDFAVEQYESDR